MWMVSLGALATLVLGGPATAQTPPSDDSAWGDLLGNGAEVGAFDPGTGGNGGGGAPGGSGSRSTITCTLSIADTGQILGEADLAQLQREYEAAVAGGASALSVDRSCVDASGQIIIDDTIAWTPAMGSPVAPEVLAEMARDRLQLPHPAAQMAPDPAVGATAQLPTYFWLTNWPAEPLWQEASAGTVTARVTATPVRQTWRIADEMRGQTYTQNCGATAGVAYTPGDPPPAGACSWLPEHSSAGQPTDHPTSGEPCFETTVTVYWSLSWVSRGSIITAPTDLGTVPMTSVACIVVAEVQAVVSNP